MKAIDDYTAALSEIQAATLADKMVWRCNRPGLYVHKTMNHELEDLVLTLEKIDSPAGTNFQLHLIKKDFETSEVILSIDTSTSDDGLKDSLSDFYNFIEYHVDLKGLVGLKEFISIVNNGTKNDDFFDEEN